MELIDFMIQQGTVEQDYEFQKEHFCIEFMGKALLVCGGFELFHMEKQIMAFSGGQMHDTGGGAGLLEAGGEILLLPGIMLQEPGRYIDDDAFVGYAWLGDRTMDLAGAHEQDIAGGERIGFSLNDVVGPAIQEQYDFVEIMVMEGNGLHGGILQAEDPEFLAQIALLFIVWHDDQLLMHHYRAFFAIYKAYEAI